MLKEKDTYGILVIDGNDATIATLKGRSLHIVKEFTSGLPGKHRAGGQSQRRFERLRETEVNDYFRRVGNHANDIFLPFPDLKGILIGGPGPTKEDFGNGDYLQYTLKNKVLATVDTSYVGEQGVKEVVEKSPEVFKEVRYYEEKKLVQDFLYELGHDTGLVTYGESEVRKALDKGIVKKLLISEEFNEGVVTITCSNCGYTERKIIKGLSPQILKQETGGKLCQNCSQQTLEVIETKDIMDEIAEMAEKTGSEVEVISKQSEEGISLKESFGGFAAILRYKQ
jgi:peptide chain release factor subunit 1